MLPFDNLMHGWRRWSIRFGVGTIAVIIMAFDAASLRR
jgi:hypothetical protein